MDYNKWYDNYIKDINIDNIEWINLNNKKLNIFYKENYYDNNSNSYIYDKEMYTNSNKYVPIGMYYIEFDTLPGTKYLLGICNNNINKKTILACLNYTEDYILFADQKNPITYFSTIETNTYFRGLGLSKKLIYNSYNYIKQNQNILISDLSELGRKTNMLDMTINILNSLDFNMDIRSDTDNFNKEEYHKLVKRK